MNLSMVTYTYNDAGLAQGLLDAARSWSMVPDEVLVVDDGSPDAFSPKPGTGCEVIRLDRNRGPAEAKGAGISACSGDIVLSLDCDIRPDPDWLATALLRVRDPRVGLVGAPVLAAGDDVVSRYARRFGVYVPAGGEVGLVSGEIWLMRREVWERAGGFSGFSGRTHEDFHFSRRVSEAGLALALVDFPPVHGIRRLARTDYVRRHVSYTAGLSAAYVSRAGRSALVPLIRATAARLAAVLAEGEASLAYMELFKFAAFVLAMLAGGLRFESGPVAERRNFAGGLVAGLEAMPATLRLLESDLASIGLPLPAEAAGDGFWAGAFYDLNRQADDLFGLIESEGVRQVIEDEMSRTFDFHYLREAGADLVRDV